MNSGSTLDFRFQSAFGGAGWTHDPVDSSEIGLSKSHQSSSSRMKLEDSSEREVVVYEASDLFQLFQAARLFCDGVSESTLRAALREAIALKGSGLFPEFIKPEVGIDECGEFSFSVRNSKGYLDIGVSGVGELSFHVRNDCDPSATEYGDMAWDGNGLPLELVESSMYLLND